MNLHELRRRVGQMLVIGFDGLEPNDEVKKFINENNIGGICLLGRNVGTPVQVCELTNQLQSLVPKGPDYAPLFMGIDMEGGRVHRLKAPFTQWPAMGILGEIGSASLGFKFAESLGHELMSVGINLDFAPCADVLTNPENKVIGDRSFGSDSELVAKISSSVVRGLVKSGVLPCVKHFPGHGDTLLDSHEDLPRVTNDLARLEKVEFPPFQKCFRARADLCMTAHLVMEKIDPEVPATMSAKVLQDILRGKLGFRQAIITDDMEMKAITSHYTVEEATVKAVAAGCNLVMYCHTLDFQKRALEAIVKAVSDGVLSKDLIDKSVSIISKIKKDSLMPFKSSDPTKVSAIVGHPNHVKLAKAILKKEVPAGLVT